MKTSLFEGWTKQLYHRLADDKGGYCALGWLNHIQVIGRITIGEYMDACDRIGDYIKTHYTLPFNHCPSGGGAIVYANNVLKLTPEQFAEIDRRSLAEPPNKDCDPQPLVEQPDEQPLKEENELVCP